MLRSVQIRNFKGFADEARVDLRPVTLLFGPNSAGKSTVLDALGYAWRLLSQFSTEENPLPGRIPDDFSKLVHGHDLSRQIGLELEGDGVLGGAGTDEHYLIQMALEDFAHDTVDEQELAGLLSQVRVQIEVGHDEATPLGRVLRASGDFHDHQVVRLEELDARSTRVLLNPQALNDLLSTSETGRQLSPWMNRWLEEVGKDAPDARGWSEVGVLQFRQLPAWTTQLVDTQMRAVPPLVHLLIAAPFEIIREQIGDILHVGPIRTLPRENYHPDAVDFRSWHDGLAAWATLFASTNEGEDPMLLEHVNRWMGDSGHLDSGHSISLEPAKLLPLDNDVIDSLARSSADELREVLAGMETYTRIRVRDIERQISIEASDVGSGIAQLVPIVVAAMARKFKNRLVCIEQPELHVHPRTQTSLADLFLRARHRLDDRHFLIETHSEHLLLRLLRRIRETTYDQLPQSSVPERIGYTPEQKETIRRDSPPTLMHRELAVYVVERQGKTTQLTELLVDDDGEFAGGWPQGFFDERMGEL